MSNELVFHLYTRYFSKHVSYTYFMQKNKNLKKIVYIIYIQSNYKAQSLFTLARICHERKKDIISVELYTCTQASMRREKLSRFFFACGAVFVKRLMRRRMSGYI